MSPTVVVPSVKFNNGLSMPIFGLGTYKSQPGQVERAIQDAIDAGYRHFDTALYYGNEKEVGAGIRAKIEDGTVTREEIFVTTKLWNNSHSKDLVVPTCRKSAQDLGLEYIDLYLVHWPFAFKEGSELNPVDEDGNVITADTDYLETWEGMEECVTLGLTKSIGVSNFNSEQLTRLLAVAKIKPVNNQVEVNLNFNQRKLIKFCNDLDITVTAYTPLGRPENQYGISNGLEHPKVLEIAAKYKKTPVQIVLRYLVQLGVAPVPKSVTKSRIEENINIFDFELTPDEVALLDTLGSGERVNKLIQFKDHKYYPFGIPF